MSEFLQKEFHETVLSSEYLFRGRVFDVELAEIELPDQSKSKREIVHHHGGAAIVAVDSAENVYLVEQYRISVKSELLEIPAGKLEAGEAHRDCAERELFEELGIKAGRLELLTGFYPTPGYCSEEIQVFLAEDLTIGENQLDPGEFLRVKKFPLQKTLEMIGTGAIKDAKTIIGLILTAQKLKDKKQLKRNRETAEESHA